MTGATLSGSILGTRWLAPGGLHPDPLKRGTHEPAGADILIFAVLAVIGFHLLSLPFHIDSIREGVLRGPDDYTRMARVRDLLANGWFGPVLERVGDGELQHHWTRPMDAVIAGLYHLFVLVLPGREALHWAGSIASPLVHVVSVVATVAVLRKRLTADTLMTLVLVLMLMPVFYIQFRLGRPDHHGLQIGLMSVLLALTLRMVIDIEHARPVRRLAWGAGGVAALLAWSAPGGLLPVMAVLGSLGLLWVLRGGVYAGIGLHTSAATTLAALVILPLERGSGFAVLDSDRLSLIHVTILGFATAVFGAAQILDSKSISLSPQESSSRALRSCFAALSGIVGLGLSAFLLPSLLFAEHLLEIDSFYRSTRSLAIRESQPLLSMSMTPPSELYLSIARFMQFNGILILAPVAFVLAFLRRPWGWPYLVPPAVVILAYMILYHDQHFGLIYKNAGYLSIPLTFLYAGLVGDAAAWLRETTPRGSMLAAVATKFVAAGWPLTLAVPFALLAANAQDLASRPTSCEVHESSSELNSLAIETNASARILAVPELAGELLYRTDFRVLAIPTHRYQSDYRLMYTLFSESDPARALDHIRDHNIDGFVTCARYDKYFQDTDAHLHGHLARGATPPGFERLTRPEEAVQVHMRIPRARDPQH